MWQVAVDAEHQGLGLAARMLDSLIEGAPDEAPIRMLETTITDDNAASQRLFHKFAERWSADDVTVRPLFERSHFPGRDDHDAEPLYEIGPLRTRG